MDPIVVIGGGITGTSIAAHLQTEAPVVLLEKNDLLGGGATADSIAMFGWSYDVPPALIHRAWAGYEPLIESDTLSFERIGTLHTRESEAGVKQLRSMHRRLDKFNVESELLKSEDISTSMISIPDGSTALSIPSEGYLDTADIISYYTGQAREQGVDIRTGTTVTDILVNDGEIVGVEAGSDQYAASRVINAAGPWAPNVNELAGVSLPLRHNRGPIVVLDRDTSRPLPNTSFENGLYVREEGRTGAFVGRTGRSYPDATVEEPDAARQVDESFYLAVEELCSGTIPALSSARIVTEWVGLRTITPDGRPLIGQTSIDGFYVTAGLSGHGVTLAPVVGQLVDALVTDGVRPPSEVTLNRIDTQYHR